MKKQLLNKYQLQFEAALRSKLGIKVYTDNVDACKQHLYQAKKKLIDRGMTDYEQLQFVTPHQNQQKEIWIVKKGNADE